MKKCEPVKRLLKYVFVKNKGENFERTNNASLSLLTVLCTLQYITHSRLELRREEWEPYAFWDSDKLYTRNLVATDNKTFTLLLLCWNPGKESPIHDHPCEGCWVKSIQGTVKETIYQMDDVQGLVPEKENFFHPGELSYIEGTRAWEYMCPTYLSIPFAGRTK